MRAAPLEGLCPELAAMFARNVDAALESRDAPLDDDDEAALAVDALGVGLAQDDVLGGGDFGGGGNDGGDFGDAGGGFDAYGDDLQQQQQQQQQENPSTQQLLDDDFALAADDGDVARTMANNAAAPDNAAYFDSDDEQRRDDEHSVADEAAAALAAANTTPGDDTQQSWSLHTQRMHTFLELTFKAKKSSQLSFNELAEGKRRKTVAATFFELLVLKSKGYVELAQAAPYADIKIAKGKKMR